MCKQQKLVIACGNSLRQDDGAGLLLADGLAAYWQAREQLAGHIQVQQLTPELALAIAEPSVDEVWFVDCRVVRDERDTAIQIQPIAAKTASPASGHQFSPALLLLYARTLFDPRPSLEQPAGWQITIPGFQFGHGETLSPICQAILDAALRQLAAGRLELARAALSGRETALYA